MDKNNVVYLRTKARPIQGRDQSEIFEERRKKRKEKIEEVKRKYGKKL